MLLKAANKRPQWAAKFEDAGYCLSPDGTKNVHICHVHKFAAEQSSPEMLWVRLWKWCSISSFWSVSMTWWSRGCRSVVGVIMTSISVCQTELSGWQLNCGPAIPYIECGSFWTLVCLPEYGGTVVYPVEHIKVTASKVCWVLKAAFARQFFPAVFNCEASLIRQVAVLCYLEWLCHFWFNLRAAELRCWGKKNPKINSPSWRA